MHCSIAKIGCAVAEADAVLSVTHFKGHELVGFGGAIKNLGMGCASRAGKKFLHEVSHPVIDREACTGCGTCVKNCASEAITLDAERKAVIDHEKPASAAASAWPSANSAPPGPRRARPARSAASVSWSTPRPSCRGRPAFHVSFVMNVSPNCDCWGTNDAPSVVAISESSRLGSGSLGSGLRGRGERRPRDSRHRAHR